MSVQIDMDKVVGETVQQLGAQLASMTLELNAQRAANAALAEASEQQAARIAELEQAQGGGD